MNTESHIVETTIKTNKDNKDNQGNKQSGQDARLGLIILRVYYKHQDSIIKGETTPKTNKDN